MKNGRIEVYVHSDNITDNKGGCVVRVTCQSEAAARTEEFKAFAKRAAYLCYAASHTDMDVYELFPEFAEDRQRLMTALKEEIFVQDVKVIKLDDDVRDIAVAEIDNKEVILESKKLFFADKEEGDVAVMHSEEEIDKIFDSF